jgi:hypothetical protein
MKAICRKFMTVFTTALILFLLLGCISTPFNTEQDAKVPSADGEKNEHLRKQIESGDIFESRDNLPKTSTIGIIKPEVPANSLMSAEEMWIPDMIKSTMNSNFTQFAKGKIVVVNLSSDVDKARNNEIEKSLSGSNDELSLVLRKAAYAILTGEVIKQSQTRFILSFTVIETETGIQLASYSKPHSDIEISSGRAVNTATEELLKQLNIVLNEAGKFALYGASNEAETFLAKGNEAANSGQSLQAMNYLFNAASFGTTATQASAKLSSIQNQNQKELQGEGGRVMDFFQRQTFWQDRIDEYNEFYYSNPPFELYYTPPKISHERVENHKKLYDLGFELGLRWNKNQISAMEKVLHEYVLDGLKKNSASEIKRWDLKGLPEDSYLFKGPDNITYDLIIQVENERGEAITSGGFKLYGSLFYLDGKIYALCTQRITRLFENIEYDESKMTNNLYVRVISVNGINIQAAGENGFLRVIQTQDNNLPPVQRDNLPLKLSSKLENEKRTGENRQKREIEVAERRQKEEQRAKERRQREEQRTIERKQKQEQEAAEKREKEEQEARARASNFFLYPHFYIAAYGGYNYSFDGQYTVNLDMGISVIQYLDLHFGGLVYLGTKKDIVHDEFAESPTPLGLKVGVSLIIPSARTVLRFSPAYTFLFIEKKEGLIGSDGVEDTEKYSSYGVGSLSVFLDWKPFGPRYRDGVFIRLGYRLDVYPPELSPIFDKNEENIFFSHNFMAGLVLYMGR